VKHGKNREDSRPLLSLLQLNFPPSSYFEAFGSTGCFQRSLSLLPCSKGIQTTSFPHFVEVSDRNSVVVAVEFVVTAASSFVAAFTAAVVEGFASYLRMRTFALVQELPVLGSSFLIESFGLAAFAMIVSSSVG
jgi:hypothetical protein